jgi:hypothetical protein
MDSSGAKATVNGRVIIAPVKIMNKKTYVMLDGECGTKHWILLESLSDALKGTLLWDDKNKVAIMNVR